MRRRLGVVALLAVSISGCSGSGEASGCENFNPVSSALAVGETTTVEVELADSHWGNADVAGSYWVNHEPAPQGAPETGVLTGEATLIEANIVAGGIRDGIVRIDFGAVGIVDFAGPISCG
jgi:hypothetical protein